MLSMPPPWPQQQGCPRPEAISVLVLDFLPDTFTRVAVAVASAKPLGSPVCPRQSGLAPRKSGRAPSPSCCPLPPRQQPWLSHALATHGSHVHSSKGHQLCGKPCSFSERVRGPWGGRKAPRGLQGHSRLASRAPTWGSAGEAPRWHRQWLWVQQQGVRHMSVAPWLQESGSLSQHLHYSMMFLGM